MKPTIKARKSFDDSDLFFLESGINVKERTILIIGDIESHLIGNVFSGLQAMLAHNKTDPIHVYINSFGGCAYTSFAIYDILKNCPAPIETHVIGSAMSGGSIILMAGDIRKMSANSVIMLHSCSAVIAGKVFADLVDNTDECKRIHHQLCDIYGSVTNISTNQWVKKIKYRDIYFRLDEAINIGLITSEE